MSFLKETSSFYELKANTDLCGTPTVGSLQFPRTWHSRAVNHSEAQAEQTKASLSHCGHRYHTGRCVASSGDSEEAEHLTLIPTSQPS